MSADAIIWLAAIGPMLIVGTFGLTFAHIIAQKDRQS